jgi:hypothetical protein
LQKREHLCAGRRKAESKFVVHASYRVGISASSHGLCSPIMDLRRLWGEIPPANAWLVRCIDCSDLAAALDYLRGFSLWLGATMTCLDKEPFISSSLWLSTALPLARILGDFHE